MNATLRHTSSITFLAILFASLSVGCAQIRKLTYPEDFTYLEKREVDTLMRQMSESVVRLDQLVAQATPTESAQQQKIIGELDQLDRIATHLSGGHKQTNFPALSEHIGEFIGDIEDARLLASATPPNYSSARKLTNSCLACHKFR